MAENRTGQPENRNMYNHREILSVYKKQQQQQQQNETQLQKYI